MGKTKRNISMKKKNTKKNTKKNNNNKVKRLTKKQRNKSKSKKVKKQCGGNNVGNSNNNDLDNNNFGFGNNNPNNNEFATNNNENSFGFNNPNNNNSTKNELLKSIIENLKNNEKTFNFDAEITNLYNKQIEKDNIGRCDEQIKNNNTCNSPQCLSGTMGGHTGALTDQIIYNKECSLNNTNSCKCQKIKCAKKIDDEGHEFMFYMKLYALDGAEKLAIHDGYKISEFIPEIDFSETNTVLCQTCRDVYKKGTSDQEGPINCNGNNMDTRFIMENLKSSLSIKSDDKTYLLDFKLGYFTVSKEAKYSKQKSQGVVDTKTISDRYGFRLESSGDSVMNEQIKSVDINKQSGGGDEKVSIINKIKTRLLIYGQEKTYNHPKTAKSIFNLFGAKNLIKKIEKGQLMSVKPMIIFDKVFGKYSNKFILELFLKLHNIMYHLILPNYLNINENNSENNSEKYSFGLIGSSLMIAIPQLVNENANPKDLINIKISDLGHGYLYHYQHYNKDEIKNYIKNMTVGIYNFYQQFYLWSVVEDKIDEKYEYKDEKYGFGKVDGVDEVAREKITENIIEEMYAIIEKLTPVLNQINENEINEI